MKKKSWKLSIYTAENDGAESYWTSKSSTYSKFWDTVALDSEVKRDIRNDLDTFLRSEQRYKSIGLPFQRGYLFYG